MNILDALIIIFLLIGALAGFKRGLIKQGVLLVGLIVVLVLSFYIRIPVSNFFYKNLPFFNFDGIFKGMSVLNILIYESIAFLIVLRILIKISGLIEKILKATIILGFFSKIGGMIVGAIESYVIVFVILFVASQPFLKVSGMEESKFTPVIVNKTPFLSTAVEDFRFVFDEIEKIVNSYKDEEVDFNQQTIDIFLKYNIITKENIDVLKEKGKIKWYI